ADSRQSLEGLKYTMQSVLEMHGREDKAFAAPAREAPRFVRQGPGGPKGGRCIHCHQVRQILNAELKRKGGWSGEMVWRYPLHEIRGVTPEGARGKVVKEVKDPPPASAAGLKTGDRLQQLNGVPVHSFADAQLALDRAPKTGAIEVVWRRGDA